MNYLVLNESDKKLVKKEIQDCSNIKLKVMQEEVNGIIDIPFISDKFEQNGIDVVINDEGKINGKCTPCLIIEHKHCVVDILYGNVMFVGHDKKGNSIGLTDSQIEFIENSIYFKKFVTIYLDNIILLPTITI